MYCKYCGREIGEANYCSFCGGKQGEIRSAYTQSVWNVPVEPPRENANDRPNFWLGLLSFLFPLVGLILFLCMRDGTPKRARNCGICALVGFVVDIVLVVIIVSVTMWLFFDGLYSPIFNYPPYDPPYIYY
ncbi:MAG: hypothetical protein ACI4U2_02530 [Christensenellaceae bacterium]